MSKGLPGLSHVDHVGLTVPNLDAAVRFYCDVIGGHELYRLGPFDAAEIPRMSDGRDWTQAHINVAGARLTIAMLSIGPNLMLELFQYDLPADRRTQPPRNCDLGGHHIAFKVENLEAAKSYLADRGCKVMAGPIVLDQGPCATTRVNYVLDPFGNQLELVEYTTQAFEASAPVKIYRPTRLLEEQHAQHRHHRLGTGRPPRRARSAQAGYQVTLYSDRTAAQWLNESRPTGTAARFHISLEYERELGLNHWEKDAPKGEGVHLTFCPSKDNRLLTLAGRLKDYFLAIDLRLQSHRWMNDLAAKGGKIEIENVTVARLDQIAAAHDLTIVAAGRADLCNLFERDAERSVYDKPQRNLTMIITTGGKMGFAGVPFLPVKFNFFAPFGEAFYVPYFHKDHGPTWNMLIEAKPGGPLDRFGDCKSGEQAVELYKQVIKDVIPWDYDWAKDMQLADPNGWLVGRFAPTVRKPVGRLPSGRIVTPLGDTAMALDPVGGQGANNGNKMARNLVESIIARKDRPFDAAWMTETFERFYARSGDITYTFNNLLLEPITNAGKQLLIAQYGSDGRAEARPASSGSPTRSWRTSTTPTA